MIQPFYYLVLEGFAFIVCLLIYINLRKKKAPMLDEKVYLCMVLGNMLILVADIFTWYSNGATFAGARFTLIASNVAYYLLGSTILFLWSMYVFLRIRKNNARYHLGLIIPAGLPIMFLIVMSATAPLNGLFFYVDADNVYHRGPWCWVQGVIAIGYIVYAAIYALVHCIRVKNSQEKREARMLVIISIFPLICSLVQSQYFGLPLIWIGTTISFLIFFIETQNSQISIDALTQLNNRGKFDEYIRQNMHNMKNTETLYLIVIDIDYFKSINDRFGHIEGDNALKAFADLLKRACMTKKDFAARYGGDEFAAVCIRSKSETVSQLMNDLLQYITEYNEKSNKPYALSISFGTAAYRNEFPTTEDALKHQADGFMYEMKACNHATIAEKQSRETPALPGVETESVR